MILKGEFSTRRVWLNGQELDPKESLSLRDHSPDGFNWGYGGSGPSQLALTLAIETSRIINVPIDKAVSVYQQLKWDFVATLPQSDFEVDLDIESWMRLKLEAVNA